MFLTLKNPVSSTLKNWTILAISNLPRRKTPPRSWASSGTTKSWSVRCSVSSSRSASTSIRWGRGFSSAQPTTSRRSSIRVVTSSAAAITTVTTMTNRFENLDCSRSTLVWVELSSCGGLVVGNVAFYSIDPSANPAVFEHLKNYHRGKSKKVWSINGGL